MRRYWLLGGAITIAIAFFYLSTSVAFADEPQPGDLPPCKGGVEGTRDQAPGPIGPGQAPGCRAEPTHSEKGPVQKQPKPPAADVGPYPLPSGQSEPSGSTKLPGDLPECKGGMEAVRQHAPGPMGPGDTPGCRAKPTLSEKGPVQKRTAPTRKIEETGVLSTGYHWLGGQTDQDTTGIFGRIFASNPDVPTDPNGSHFFAARFLEKREVAGRWLWIEVGWAEAAWRGASQFIYVWDTAHGEWHYFDQYVLTRGRGYEVELLNVGGNVWRAYLYYNGQWNLLHEVDVGFGAGDWVEEYGEVYTPDGSHFLVPETRFYNVQLATPSWNLWGTQYATQESNWDDPYETRWVNKYHNWGMSWATDDNNLTRVTYAGNWTHASGWPRTYNTTVSWSNEAGASYSITFYGSRITWLYSMGYNRGSANVYIDDQYVETWSQYAATTRWQAARNYTRTRGWHTFKVVVVGNGFVDLDAAIIADGPPAGRYDDIEPQIRYINEGDWTHGTGWPTYNGTVSWSNVTGAEFFFTLEGTSVTWCFDKAYNRGIASVTFDGAVQADVDLYSPTTVWCGGPDTTRTYSGGSGFHTLVVTASGNKNPSSSDYYVDIDLLDVN